MFVFGLTGGIACGKSTVVDYWKLRGLHVVDADKIAHGVLHLGSVRDQIVARFSETILDASGQVDRKLLGRRVFSNKRELSDLESIVHPIIQKHADVAFDVYEMEGAEFACYDAPLLYERGLEWKYSPVVVVSAHSDIQLSRLMQRGLSETEALQRINSQMPLEEKILRCDYHIDNSGSLEDLHRRCKIVMMAMKFECSF